MQDEALQAAFEIKAACDEISRRLLRWHWEQKPGAHSLDALLKHIRQRQTESPVYYERMPDLESKTSWQQLDTTLCMRVLLDPEKDAARPLDLLGNTPHPAAARRACNAVRMARNQAAHAAADADAAQAAILFNEAVESLEEGYLGTAFRENELAQYYREAESYLERCSTKKAAKQPRQSAPRTVSGQTAGRRSSKPHSSTQTQSSTRQKTSRSAQTARRKNKKQKNTGRGVLLALLAVAVLGLLVRAFSMGLFSR